MADLAGNQCLQLLYKATSLCSEAYYITQWSFSLGNKQFKTTSLDIQYTAQQGQVNFYVTLSQSGYIFFPKLKLELYSTGVSKLRIIKRIRRIHILRKIVISKLRRISIIFISLIILKKNFSYSFSHELPPRINIVFSVSNFLSTDNFKKI